MSRFHALALGVALTACVEAGGTPPDSKGEDPCGASEYAGSIGQPASSLTFPPDRSVRVLAPDSMMTMDYRIDRLNVLTDDTGLVIEFRCG
ncbi:I78 family peptidase inhibitor [Roseivivax sp. CAU 1753]